MARLLVVVLLVAFAKAASFAYRPGGASMRTHQFLWSSKEGGGDGSEENLTKVGTRKYYNGFFSSPLVDKSVASSSRGDGVEQAAKLGAGAALLLVGLTVAFLASNNLV
ncbi:hypothetical protein B484DRAFT_460139 [Ochromonadaceae sp. CCMP2298]|nr:hypothetical protein B484DRAFT_460139 [Ochromonadaceae sp. CCMP2298]|mmetsp:Transcript_7290/g.15950  ORF Transcript_7290/g.15950 Transcript_7290/m.15950 type:complete len:109 (-) Transcript_7290:186-512(-)|eukprot:CAMPEP_0173240202 /NCGR_PEP_ID=MMETSP1142-20121109/13632_1 /TAXON_ID=483371 /ORGANISM="non described non described, Strain CCMP2298" /LENGTH=108 /DNA_ID=CAMNT_0014171291 /DNA_START=38 /DNA_END=364 /DNA_ORIENTATION=+